MASFTSVADSGQPRPSPLVHPFAAPFRDPVEDLVLPDGYGVCGARHDDMLAEITLHDHTGDRPGRFRISLQGSQAAPSRRAPAAAHSGPNMTGRSLPGVYSLTLGLGGIAHVGHGVCHDSPVEIDWPAGATRDGPFRRSQPTPRPNTARADLPCFVVMNRAPECPVILTRTARHPVRT
jgi:hypothetical protein